MIGMRRLGRVPAARRTDRGFAYVEALVGLALLLIVSAPVLQVAAAARRLTQSQAEATDLHQRARVAADKLQRDVTMAGAGPLHSGVVGSLASYLPPVLPARTGVRAPDPALSAHGDRLTVLFVPEGGWSAPLVRPTTDPRAGIAISPAGLGCPGAGFCGFTAGSRALIFDALGRGLGYDLFTVSDIAGELAHDAPLSRLYDQATTVVVPVVQRVYYFDRPGRRLMLYDGDQSDLPLVDHVADVTFSYFVRDGPGLRPVSLSELTDGPILGAGVNVFDADLLSIALVRVTVRLEAAADEMRGSGRWFAKAGRSTHGESRVHDVELTFDVAPRNMFTGGAVP